MLIPQPRKMETRDGFYYLSPKTKIVLSANCDHREFNTAQLLQDEIQKNIGFKLEITKSLCNNEEQSIYLKKEELGSEHYQLDLSLKGIIIKGDDKGVFYGCQTLCQLIRNNGVKLPCLHINDYPHFPVRGFYHDVTRGKVPTLETLKELADRAAFYKLNQLQLYIEHSYAFAKHSEVWMGADPLTAEEIMILDEYCQKRHIELVPSLSTFGHLYQVLSSNSFCHLCELEDSQNQPYSWISRMQHHTLDVSNPESFEFVKNMIDEFIPLFTSNKFNIGCDETFDLGKGKNKKRAQEEGTGKLYVEFLSRVIKYVQSYDKKVMFWSDIIIKYPEMLSEVPEDVIYLNWNYGENPTEEHTKIIADAGLTQYVCPSVSGCNRMMNDMDMASSNIKKMIKYGQKYHAQGVLNTDWGDYGHINLFANSIPGMIFGAALSWNTEHTDDSAETDKQISKLEFGDGSGRLVGLLRDLARQQIAIWGHVIGWKDETFLNIPMLPFRKEELIMSQEQDIINAYERALDISEEILSVSRDIISVRDRQKDLQEFYIAAQGTALMQALLLVIKKYNVGQEINHLIFSPIEMAERLEYWFVDFGKIWRRRNKESELYRIREVISQLCNYLRKLEM